MIQRGGGDVDLMTSFQPRPVFLAESFMLPVGKFDGRHRENRSFLEMAESVQALFQRGRIPREKIGCLVVGSQNPFAFSGIDNVAAKIAGVLGLSGAKSLLIDTASSSGASAFEAAYMEIASGRYDHVLAIGIQKMSDVETADATRIVAGVIDRDEAEFGLTMPACGALVARALMTEFDLNRQEWSKIAARLTERSHRHAARNPDAHLQWELPAEKYFADAEAGKNYLYYDPLRYYDFCPMSDGVAACLLTSSPQEVMIAGVGAGTDIPTIADRQTFTSFPATVIALRYALGMAGVSGLEAWEGQIHLNMHDPFNGFGPINLVDFGVVPRERLLEGFLDDQLTGPGGRFPTNLTGGLKARGHPLGATGMIQVVENHRLIREGRFNAGLSHSIGGPINNNVVIILERTSYLQARKPVPFKPRDLPALSHPKPPQVTLTSLFQEQDRVTARLLAGTTHYHFKSGKPQNILLLFSASSHKQEYRFLIGVDPEAVSGKVDFTPGSRILLRRSDGLITVNEVPVRRLYRKGLDGIVELADSFRRLRRRRG